MKLLMRMNLDLDNRFKSIWIFLFEKKCEWTLNLYLFTLKLEIYIVGDGREGKNWKQLISDLKGHKLIKSDKSCQIIFIRSLELIFVMSIRLIIIDWIWFVIILSIVYFLRTRNDCKDTHLFLFVLNREPNIWSTWPYSYFKYLKMPR